MSDPNLSICSLWVKCRSCKLLLSCTSADTHDCILNKCRICREDIGYAEIPSTRRLCYTCRLKSKQANEVIIDDDGDHIDDYMEEGNNRHDDALRFLCKVPSLFPSQNLISS